MDLINEFTPSIFCTSALKSRPRALKNSHKDFEVVPFRAANSRPLGKSRLSLRAVTSKSSSSVASTLCATPAPAKTREQFNVVAYCFDLQWLDRWGFPEKTIRRRLKHGGVRDRTSDLIDWEAKSSSRYCRQCTVGTVHKMLCVGRAKMR